MLFTVGLLDSNTTQEENRGEIVDVMGIDKVQEIIKRN